jgi:hypothetical protein
MPIVRQKMLMLGFIQEDDPPIFLNRPFKASTVRQMLTPYNTDLLKVRLPEANYGQSKSVLEQSNSLIKTHSQRTPLQDTFNYVE